LIEEQMTAAESRPLEFRLLGPVEAVQDGKPVPLGGPRQRMLLALLLLEPGRPVPADRLAEELWQGRPPPGAETTLRSYVSRLRKVLGGNAAITRGDSSYILDVPPDQIDRQRFEQLTGEGREALARGAVRRAAERLRAALELWNGRPFGELADEGALRLEADRLDELRLLALEGRIEADLALGVGGELVTELEVLLDRHPYRERLWRQLMLALYRAERQADALAAYRRARQTFDNELGLEPSEELRALEQAILQHKVPPAEPPERRDNLPTPLTSFVGREGLLADVERLLVEERLVTLTGVGGVGKTRLALETATRAAPDFPDGAYFVDFSGLTEPSLVTGHVAAALDLRERADTPVFEQLAVRLSDSDLLLVLDNCEHLREVCAELVQSLLGRCSRLVVLATSREPLGVPGEIDYSVPPLAVPLPDASPDELRSADAVRLFLSRARAARPTLAEDGAVLSSAAEICRDLDGLPLAIELAAARAKALSLEDIAARLSDRFRFLVSWRRLTPARHRTLREAMDWSYGLLSDDERHLLALVSVFAGGFTLDAAASTYVDGDGERALDLVGRLVDASLVVAEVRDGATRYRLLETVRQYAAERLEETDRADHARGRHAEWCLMLAEEAEPQFTGDQQTRWFATLDAEADNLRAALAHLSRTGRWETQLRLTIALSRFWYVRGHLAEARQWLDQALAASADQDPANRRRALTAAAAVALLQGEYADSTALAEEALIAARSTGDPRHVANALSNLGAIVLAAGDHERAATVLEEAVTLARDVGDARIAALAINNLGDQALTVGDYERAEPLFEESLTLLRARGDTSNIARSLFNLGAVALQSDRREDARGRFRESLALAEEAGDKEDLAWCLEGVAALGAAGKRGERAALLLGAAGALLQSMGAALKPFERRLHTETESRARDLLGSERFDAAAKEGATLALTEALTLARDELDTV
jgi:predicted ATPase/DNA-binding SARP family transcriptional activator